MRFSFFPVHNFAAAYGFDRVRFAHAVRHTPYFIRTWLAFRRMSKSAPSSIHIELSPVLYNLNEIAGSAAGHYFHQDLWAARRIFAARPAEHVDVGSRIDGFVAHLLAFMPVQVIDIRPLPSSIDGLTFVQSDATHLSNLADNNIISLSSLHAVEHFGLGRYGDPIDPDACFKAMRALERVLKPGGKLYFSVPIGRERVEFNAHRVFAPRTILQTFSALELVSFSAVDDAGALHEDADPNDFVSAEFALGLYEFTKR